MTQGFNDVFLMLEDLNVMDSLLPFLLIFTVLYAILNKTKIIGEGRKNFNVMVALVLSLMVVIPHITGKFPDPTRDPVVIINTAIPNVSVIIIAVLAVLLIIGIFGKNLDIAGSSLAGWVAIGAFLAVAWIFGSAAGLFGDGFFPLPSFLQDSDTQALLVMILVFGLIIMFITSDGSETKVEGPLGNILNAFRGAIKPP